MAATPTRCPPRGTSHFSTRRTATASWGTAILGAGTKAQSFTSPIARTTIASGGTTVRYMASGDFNGDGIRDIAVPNGENSTTISIFLGRGDGTFTKLSDVTVGTAPNAIAVGDFNGDGIK